MGRNAAGQGGLAGAAVFLGLYLAVGIGLYWNEWWRWLIWQYRMGRLSGWLLRAVLIVLAAFADVVFLVYRLRLAALLRAGKAAWLEVQVLALQTQLDAARQEARRAAAAVASKTGERSCRGRWRRQVR